MNDDIARVVLRVWRGRQGPDELSPEELRAAGDGVRRLRAGLVGARALVGEPYLDEQALRDAYLLYHVPLNAARMASLLPELGGGFERVLDIGAGPGSLGLAAALAGDARVLSTDRSERALALGRRIAIELGLAERWQYARWALPGEAPPLARTARFDLILMGNVINELWKDDDDRAELRADWIAQIAKTRLAPGGRIVVIEPALRETGRGLLAVRDHLVEAGLRVLAPCLTQTPCPALERPRDWCHQARVWPMPRLVEQLSEAANVDNARLNFAYLVLAADSADSGDSAESGEEASLFRIVSAPIVEKGKLVLWGCGARGRHKIVRLNRQRSETNELFGELDRGDVVRMEALAEKGDGLRVTAETSVARP